MKKIDRKLVWMRERKKNYILSLLCLVCACAVELFTYIAPLFWVSLAFAVCLSLGTFCLGVCIAFDAVLDVPNKLTVSWETLVGKHDN